jgi:hypothetical protein
MHIPMFYPLSDRVGFRHLCSIVMDCLGLRGKCGGTGGFAQEGGRVPAVGLFTHGRARGGSLLACLTQTPPLLI